MLQFLADWGLGGPQIAALIVLAQRGIEELHSSRNTKRLLNSGAREYGKTYYPVVAITHLSWIGSIFLLVPSKAEIVWPLIVAFLAIQVLRYWIIFTLEGYWTHRIISLEGAEIVKKGPYRFMRHPNYAITMLETLILPLCFGAVWLALLMSLIWGAVIRYKIELEDQALNERRALPHGR